MGYDNANNKRNAMLCTHREVCVTDQFFSTANSVLIIVLCMKRILLWSVLNLESCFAFVSIYSLNS